MSGKDLIAEPIGGQGEIAGVSELVIADVRVPLHTRLELSDVAAKIHAVTHPMVGMLLNDLDPRRLVRTDVISAGSCPPWIARLVSVGGTSTSWAFDTDHEPGSVSLLSPWIIVTVNAGTPVFTREVYAGVAFDAGTDSILCRDPPFPVLGMLRHAPNAIRTTLFGRPGLIYRPACHANADSKVTAVLYHGKPLASAERRALTTMISYLAGGRAAHALTETFDIRRKLAMQFLDRGTATTRLSPPVPLDRITEHANLVTRYLPAMAEKLAAIYRGGAGSTLDAVMHHYAEGVDSVYPTTRILRMSVALEALVNLVTGDIASNEPITSKATFRRVRAALNVAIADCAKGPTAMLSAREKQRFGFKIDNLNLASNTKRLEMFWRETKVHRTKTDDELIRKLRNDSVHQGFVGDESTSRAMWKNHREADRLVDLFNRALLSYLGYDGPVRTADGKRWVHARSGRRFAVPSTPPGPRLEIKLTSPPTPAMDAAEAQAVEGLQKLSPRTAGRPKDMPNTS